MQNNEAPKKNPPQKTSEVQNTKKPAASNKSVSSKPVSKAVKTSAPMQETSARSEGRKDIGMPVVAALLIVFLIASFVYQYVLPADDTLPSAQAQTKDYGIRISEIMSANSSAFVSDTGKYSDWLEICNTGEEAVNLYGWTLNKADDSLHPLTFGDLTIQPDEYIIIYADGKAQTAAGYMLHAPWKLTASGDTLVLLDASGAVADSVEVPSLEKNECYARTSSGEWEITRQYTPALANTAENFNLVMQYRNTTSDAIVISEVMIKNRTYALDEDGDASDYIELHNTSDRAVNLGGYALSDSDANLTKWVLPDTTIEAGGYLLVYASGKNRTSLAMHTGFKLSEGESVFLTNPDGQLIDCVTPETTQADQAWSLTESGFSALVAPTPRYSNDNNGISQIDAQLTANNRYKLYISEIMTSTNETDVSSSSYDWVEIYNGSAGTVDLSGIALSDDSNHLRKWQFPSGASIGAGEYKIVYLTGGDEVKENGTYCADFRLSKDGGYHLLLSSPTGEMIDRIAVGTQYTNISYGRSYSLSGLRYYTDPTPKSANTTTGYAGRAAEAEFSVQGGLFDEGEQITVSLSAPAGCTIFYTTDCSDPDKTSTVYTAPITISSTTILRTMVYSNDYLPSLISTQSYLFGADHTMRVISLVSDPVNLFDYYEGIYEMGPGATGQYATYPYGSNNKGANFWMDWEKAANVELFGLDGETILSQGCGLKLQGQYSRAEAQKAFKLIARSEYGENRFNAALFDDRPYTEYQSFILRASGQDWDKTRMRDIVQTSLAAETDVMYQAVEMCVVYLNGEYWGHYNMRERINKYSISQWEDWDSEVDDIDIIKANRTVMQGSNDSFEEIVSWADENGIDTQEDIDKVAELIDIDNYLDYVAVQIYVGNPDLLNVKRYRSVNEDGKWRWILFDTDWGYTTDTNSMRRWLDPRGAGSEYKTDNRLFVALMNNDSIRDKFLYRFDELMLSSWTAEKVLAIIDNFYQELLPEIDQHLERWGFTRDNFDNEMDILIEYAQERPVKMLYYIMVTYEFDNATMNKYFSTSLSTVVLQSIDDIVAKLETAGMSKYLKEWKMDEAEFDQKLAALHEYAVENPADLLDVLYAVYEKNNNPRHDLSKFEAVLSAP